MSCSSFLLKAFSHRAYYNAELGVFEEVAVPRPMSMVESDPNVVSPTSSCSLILTDDNFVAVSRKQNIPKSLENNRLEKNIHG